jgi:hypothetical protein
MQNHENANGAFQEKNLLRFYNFRGHSPLFLLLISYSKLLTIFNRIFLEVCEKKLTFALKAK